MYKNRNSDGTLNISGKRIQNLRKQMSPKVSQKGLSEMMQLVGVDLDKNAIQRIESGERFLTDIELKAFSQILNTSADYLLGLTDTF